MKNVRRVMGLIMALITVAVSGNVTSYAYPQIMDDGVEFDPLYYYYANPDVAQSVGYNKNALYNHYKTAGQAEGRTASDPRGYYYAWYSYFASDIAPTQAKIDGILAQITTPSMSDREKVSAVTDWMCANITYDHDCDANNHRNGRDDQAETVLEDGIAVCGGYAKLFQLFMIQAGIPCAYVTGDAGGSHAWNSVQLDGRWYFIDVTWIDGGGASAGVTYVNDVPDEIRERIDSKIAELNARFAEEHRAMYYLQENELPGHATDIIHLYSNLNGVEDIYDL